MSGAYYNEFDKFAAEWLRELIKAGLIADGEVDERDMREVKPEDLRGFTQHHFFAGIGGWPYAARLAGWPDDKPLWTGSPPCQPFSAAGKRLGAADDRHLAPHWLELVRAVRPPFVAGEQVASAINNGWLRNPTQEMRELRKGVAAHEFLKQFKGALPRELQKLCERHGARKEEEQEESEFRRLFLMENEESRKGFVFPGEEQGEDEGNGIFSGHRHYSKCRGCGCMPGDRYPAESLWGEDVGFSVAGQSGQLEGLHNGQCESRYLCDECYGERMGGEQNPQGGGRNQGEKKGEGERISEEVFRKFNEASSIREFAWLDDLLDALEAENYATGAIVLPACGIGAPHIRQRIFFVGRLGDSEYAGLEGLAGHGNDCHQPGRHDAQQNRPATEAGAACEFCGYEFDQELLGRYGCPNCEGCGLAHNPSQRLDRGEGATGEAGRGSAEDGGSFGGLAVAEHHGHDRTETGATIQSGNESGQRLSDRDSAEAKRQPDPSPLTTGWDAADWLLCRDGKWRPVESRHEPLADGLPDRLGYSRIGGGYSLNPLIEKAENRVGRLKGYGNAIAPSVAAEVLKELMR